MKVKLLDYVMFIGELKEPEDQVKVSDKKGEELIKRGLAEKIEENPKDNFTKEELEEKNVTGEDGLRAIAADLDISGYNNLKKKKLIENILEAQEES